VAWNWTRKLQCLACLSAGLVFCCRFASAAPLPVSVSPTRIEIEAAAGMHVTQTIKFWNGTDTELPIHVEAGDVAQNDEEGHAIVGGEDAAYSLKSWVTPDTPDLVVFPKVQISLDFAIDIPVNADPGSHWGALLVTTTQQPAGGGAAVQARVGTIILVRVLGEAKEKLTLESFSAPRFLESPPVALEARFRNEGTVHEAPQTFVEVRNIFGYLVATGTLPERNVLPGTVRKVVASVGGGIWFGRYVVSLAASYPGGPTMRASAVVWAVPWKAYGPWALAGAIVLAFLIWRRKRLPAFWHVLRTGKMPAGYE